MSQNEFYDEQIEIPEVFQGFPFAIYRNPYYSNEKTMHILVLEAKGSWRKCFCFRIENSKGYEEFLGLWNYLNEDFIETT